ncbi:hypothetical protein [Candidatus Mesenet endosymbiont of Agriotes lineatus]|uniref:hypothetical protein n=1 Tax=Candidatus Mesenet endosymbiont of Agriotes lineatus TaxID=3077948 RepID=UPI0030D1170A
MKKKVLSAKIDSDVQKTEITINKDDLSVTGDLNKLGFCDKIEVVTKDSCLLTIEKENDEGVYKITNYQELQGLLNKEVKLIDDVATIKSKLFCKDDKTTLKSMTVLLVGSLYNTKGVLAALGDVVSAYKCIGKYIS